MATTQTTTSRPVLLWIVVLLLGGGAVLAFVVGDGVGQLLTRGDRIAVKLEGYRISPDRIVLPADETVTLELTNSSVYTHNLAIGRDPLVVGGNIVGFGEDLLGASEVAATPSHALVRPTDAAVPTTISVAPGTTVEVQLVVPEALIGTWEFGCFQGSGCEARVGVSTTVVVE
jgi:hypothetical protein